LTRLLGDEKLAGGVGGKDKGKGMKDENGRERGGKDKRRRISERMNYKG
jgi:hypothetical protein